MKSVLHRLKKERRAAMPTATAARPVRVHLAMEDGPLPRSIKQVLPVVSESHTYVESADEADLVIFTDLRAIERGYSKEKSYVYLATSGKQAETRVPANCAVISIGNLLGGLVNVLGDTRKKLVPIASAPADEPMQIRPGALRILVIDDMPENIRSAKKGLTGHRLTTATGYEEAMEILSREKFDVVLTDLHLPMSSKTMGSKFVLGQLVPYGILLMIEAARQGAKHVVVVTDLSHHDDPFSAAFDHYSRFQVKIEGAKVDMVHSPMKDGAKDWGVVLAGLVGIGFFQGR